MSTRRLLYRDRENGIIMGVCAGVANYFGINVLGIRILALAALLLFFVPTLLVYVTAGLLLRDRPLSWLDPNEESDFWQNSSRRAMNSEEAENHG